MTSPGHQLEASSSSVEMVEEEKMRRAPWPFRSLLFFSSDRFILPSFGFVPVKTSLNLRSSAFEENG